MENTQNTESNSDFEFWMEFHRENELLDGDDLVFCNCAGGPNIEDEKDEKKKKEIGKSININ